MHYILRSYENSAKGVSKMVREVKRIRIKEGHEKKVRGKTRNKSNTINTDLLFVMETTGTYHLTYANALYEKGFNVYVVNPLIIKRYIPLHTKQ